MKTRLEAIREIVIEEASASQIEAFDRYLDILMNRIPQDDPVGQVLREIAPFDPKEELAEGVTGERLLSIFSVIFGVVTAPNATPTDQHAAIDALVTGIEQI